MRKFRMSKIFFWHTITLFLLSGSPSQAQTDPDYQPVSAIVTLDSFVVTATRQGFDVNDFIRLVREDRSFYQAFRNLRSSAYLFDSQIFMYNKKGKEKASHVARNRQNFDGQCRTMDVLEEKVTGNYYRRKGTHRYYTGQLLETLFFTKGRVCLSENPEDGQGVSSGMAKHIQELKKLIFSPGERANVPFIGHKTAIFEPEMMPFYDYSISSQMYGEGIDCYVFSAKVKPDFEERKTGKTVIKSLETWFEKSTFQVIARRYQLQYSTIFYDFDVQMHIRLTRLGDRYFPEIIEYDGRWDIPGRKPEIGRFTLHFHHFNP
ncbi:MAG: hypothetical protein D6714_01460 [Bacteroidetes bacterium]|nr:MAG: hypothetical protein D6714_01460 [Bacteroidota bacterium]